MNIIFIIFISEFLVLINNSPGYISISDFQYISAIGNIDGGDILVHTPNQISIYDTNMLKKKTYTISDTYITNENFKICQLSNSIFVLLDKYNYYIYNTNDNSFSTFSYTTVNEVSDTIMSCYQNSYFVVAAITSSNIILKKYDINLNSELISMSNTIVSNNIISCIALKDYFCLFYIEPSNLYTTNYILYTSSFIEKKQNDIRQSINTYPAPTMIEPKANIKTLNVKSTIIEGNSFLLCILKNDNILYCTTVKIDNNDLSKISPKNNNGYFEANNNCQNSNSDISIGLLSNLKYASICRKDDNIFLLSITQLNDEEMFEYLKNIEITIITNQIHLVSMDNLGLGIFYNNGEARFSIAEYPICKDISLPKTGNIYPETEYEFDFLGYILNDIFDNTNLNDYLVKVFPYDYFNNSHNEVQIYHENKLLSSDTTSYQKKLSTTNWKLKAGKIHSDYQYTYKVYYSKPYLGVQKCFLNIKISCSEHCLECDIINSKSNCKICDTSQGYYKYPLDEIYICKENSTDITGYYLSSNDANGEFLECNEGCLKCYNSTNKECMTTNICENSICCNNLYYALEDHKNECYKTAPDGYYKDETNEIFKKCPSYCKTCDYEDSTNPICNTCNTEILYYPLEINGLIYCYLNASRPNGYFLYTDENGNSLYYKKCNYACDSCAEKENSISTNCINCISTYFEDPSSTTSIYKNCISSSTQVDGYYFNGVTFIQCPSKCSKCSTTSISNDKCISCNKNSNYYPLYKKTGYLTCITESEKPSNTYFDTENEIFLECYIACETCSSSGTLSQTNCLTCATNYISLETDSTQCVVNCPNYFYVHNNQNKCCNSCPITYPFLYPQTKQCYKECPNFLYNNICYDECPANTIVKGNNEKICYHIGDCESSYSSSSISKNDISSYYDSFIDDYLDEYFYTQKHVSYIESEYDEYTIIIFKNDTCTYNNMKNDLLMLDLSDCPTKLREKYNIDDNIDLTVLLVNFFIDDSSNQIEYYFYNSKTKENLNLSPCSRINIIKTITDNDNIDYDKAKEMQNQGVNVFDLNDEFFTSICYEYKTKNGLDVPLKDRVKDYYQNVTCDNGCSLNEVNLDNKIINCSCSVSKNDDNDNNIFDNKVTGEIYELIADANFEVLECYNEVFQFKFWKKNIGNFTILTLLFINTIFLIVYIINGLYDTRCYLYQFMKLNPPKKVLQTDGNYLINKKKIGDNYKIEYFPSTMGNQEHEELISQNYIQNKLKTEINNENNQNHFLYSNNEINNENNIEDSLHRENDNQLNLNKTNYKEPNIQSSKINDQSKKLIVMAFSHNYFDDEEPIYDTKQHDNILNLDLKSYEKDSSDSLNSKKRMSEKKSSKTSSIISKKEKLKPIRNFDEEELDKMEFHNAIKYDKRKFCEYYCKLLKQKQNIINTFFIYNPMKPFPIKAIAYFFMISVIFAVNCLFITESYISEKYNYKGKIGLSFILNNAINRIFYSVIVSVIINYCVSCLFDSEIRVKNLIKREEDIQVLKIELAKIIKKMKIHFLIFIICTYLLMFFFWYYLSAFCNCYNGTQKDWFFGSLICIFIVELYPFILCLISTLLWYIGIKCKADIFYKLNRCLF